MIVSAVATMRVETSSVLGPEISNEHRQLSLATSGSSSSGGIVLGQGHRRSLPTRRSGPPQCQLTRSLVDGRRGRACNTFNGRRPQARAEEGLVRLVQDEFGQKSYGVCVYQTTAEFVHLESWHACIFSPKFGTFIGWLQVTQLAGFVYEHSA